jgi:hypothetical protein
MTAPKLALGRNDSATLHTGESGQQTFVDSQMMIHVVETLRVMQRLFFCEKKPLRHNEELDCHAVLAPLALNSFWPTSHTQFEQIPAAESPTLIVLGIPNWTHTNASGRSKFMALEGHIH